MAWKQNGNEFGMFKDRRPERLKHLGGTDIIVQGKMMLVWSRIVVMEMERNGQFRNILYIWARGEGVRKAANSCTQKASK